MVFVALFMPLFVISINPVISQYVYDPVSSQQVYDPSCYTCQPSFNANSLRNHVNRVYFCDPADPRQRCFKYYHVETHKKVDFYTAKRECAALGMQLVNIENREKWGDVVLEINGVGKGYYWTSATKNQQTGKFVWENGCSMRFSNWDEKMPDNYLNRGEDCVQIRPNYKWNDFPCVGREPLGYICESIECRN